MINKLTAAVNNKQKSVSLVLGAVAFAFIASVINNSFKIYGGFSYLNSGEV